MIGKLQKHCKNCRYWDYSIGHRYNDEAGLCRIRAPMLDKITGFAAWPYSEGSDWCGEFAGNDEYGRQELGICE